MIRHNLPTNTWELNRHWSSRSEAYTGCDSLITALDNGWSLRRYLNIRRHQLGTRTTLTFEVLLQKDMRLAQMTVVDNPVLRRILLRAGLLPLRQMVMTQPLPIIESEADEAALP